MKKTKKRNILLGLLSVFTLASVGAFASCKGVNYDSLPEEGFYEYNFDQPFAATPDAYMQMDGKFDEEIWRDKNWLESTNNTTSMRVTTAFTSQGLYIGVVAYDTNVTWVGRNNFFETGVEKTNSFFKIQVIKSGQTNTEDRMKDFMLYMDCKAVCSFRERQVAAGSSMIGEVNSGETTSLSGEIFVPWKELSYTQEEVTVYGYPEDLQMDVKYLRVFQGASGNNFTVKSSPLQSYSFTSYPYYDKDGLMGSYDCEQFGNAIGGSPATDQWEIEKDAEGKVVKLTTKVDRTQAIFFRQDDEGIAKSTASDFILETRVRMLPLAEKSYPVCGLWIGSYLVTGIRGDELAKNKIMLQNSKSISDVQWMGETWDATIKNVVQTGYDKDYVDLKIVKRGAEIYYFYNDIFYKVEQRSNFANKVQVGLFANGRAEFTNFHFIDYSDNVDALTAYLADYVYFVDVQKGGAKGTVSAEAVAVKKGDALTLSVIPGVECYLSAFAINGQSQYALIEDELDIASGTYSFVPTQDTSISYKFDYLKAADTVNVSIALKNEDGEALPSTPYRLMSDSGLLFFESLSNDKGLVNLALAKAGTKLGENIFEGKYKLSFQATGYNPGALEFIIPANSGNLTFSAEAGETRFGVATVNGEKTEVNGSPSYDIEKDIYYVKSGNALQYFPSTKTDESTGYDYVVNAIVSVSPVAGRDSLGNDGNTSGVSGIAIASGKNRPIILKQTNFSWEKNRLCLEIGDYEISISGFTTALSSQGGDISIKAMRCNDTIYVFDANGEVGLYLDKDGVHLVGNRTATRTKPAGTTLAEALAGMTNLLANFFANGQENVIGLANFDTIRAEYRIDVQKGAAALQDYLRTLTFATQTSDYTATIQGGGYNGSYVVGAPVTITTVCKNSRYASKLTLQGVSGTQTIEGEMKDGKTTFTFIVKENCTVTVSEYRNIKTYQGKVTGATQAATLMLYDGDGKLIQKYQGLFNANGNYALNLIEDEYNIAVVDGNKMAFIEAGQANATMAEMNVFGGGTINGIVYTETTLDYAVLKAAAEGILVPPANNRQMTLTNSVTDGDYGYRIAVDTTASGAKNTNGAVVGITSGENSIRILRYAPRKLVLEVYYSRQRIYSVNFTDMATAEYMTTSSVVNLGAISDNSGSNYAFGFEKRDGAIYLSLGRATDDMFEIFKITPNGIEAANARKSFVGANSTVKVTIDDVQKAAINAKLGDIYNTNDYLFTQALGSFFDGNENALFVISATTTPFTIGKMPYIPPVVMTTLSGTATNAANGEAKLNLYDGTGELLSSYNATVENGTYSASVEELTLQEAASAILFQGIKAGCIDDLSASKNFVLADAYALNGSTYARIKDSLDGTFGYTSTADTYTKLNNMKTSGDYEYYFELSASNPSNVNGEAGIVIGSGTYTIRIERLRNSGASTLSIYAFNSAAATTEIHRAFGLTYSYNGNTNDNVLGYHNSSGLTQKFKLVREGTKIELYMAGETSGYVHIFTLQSGVGMTIANENFAITNSKTIEGEGMLEAVNAICAEGASNEFWLRTISLTDWQFNVYKGADKIQLTGTVQGATSAATVSVYDTEGNFVSTHTGAFDDNGNYSFKVAEGEYNLVVREGSKAACLDIGTTNGALVNAYALNGSTYAQIKDSIDGTFGYTSTADTYTKLNNMTTSGDYEYYFELSANNPNKVNGEAGIVIGSGNYSIRIERLRNAGASTLSIYAFNSAAETTEIHRAYGLTYSYNGNTNDYELGGHNSDSLTQKFKLVREGTKIELYMAGATSGYVHIFTLEYGVGMTVANNNFEITNSKTIEGSGMLEAVNAICAEGASNTFWLRTITLTDWQFNVGKV